MEETEFLSLDEERQKQVAVAYLLRNKKEIPEGLENLFSKLSSLEESAFSVMMAVKEAKRTISTLSPKSEQLAGAMSAVADLISDELDEDQIKEFGLRYDNHSGGSDKKPDMAGSTSKEYNNNNPVPISGGQVN